MPENSIQDQLKHSFPKSTKESWSSAASPDVQGKNPFEVLSWKTTDGLIFFPYYDRTDSEKIAYLKHFEFPPSENSYTGAREWVSMPTILVDDVKQANANALSALANGADGILFDVRKSGNIDVQRLLEKIDWAFCAVSFLVTSSPFIAGQLAEYIEKNNIDPVSLTGSLYCENLHDPLSSIRSLSSFKKFHSLGICVTPSSPVAELADALTKATRIMDRLTDQGVANEIAWRAISVSLTLGTDFFLDIAKLKSLRLLWYQLGYAFDVENMAPSSLNIHAVSPPWIKESFQPHSNMLKGTSASLAAVLGGCNVLTVIAEDGTTGLNRIANNISNLLREESNLDKVADAVAGAYSIDAITHQLAEAAWDEFKRNMTTL